MNRLRCIRCRRPIKSGAVHRLGQECARIILRQLTEKPVAVQEADRRQIGLEFLETLDDVMADAVIVKGESHGPEVHV